MYMYIYIVYVHVHIQCICTEIEENIRDGQTDKRTTLDYI